MNILLSNTYCGVITGTKNNTCLLLQFCLLFLGGLLHCHLPVHSAEYPAGTRGHTARVLVRYQILCDTWLEQTSYSPGMACHPYLYYIMSCWSMKFVQILHTTEMLGERGEIALLYLQQGIIWTKEIKEEIVAAVLWKIYLIQFKILDLYC